MLNAEWKTGREWKWGVREACVQYRRMGITERPIGRPLGQDAERKGHGSACAIQDGWTAVLQLDRQLY